MISVVRYVINIVINYVITSWLLIGRLPRKVCAPVVSKFHCFYLAQNLLKTRFSTRSPTCFELIDLSRHVEIPGTEIDLSGLKQVRDFFGL